MHLLDELHPGPPLGHRSLRAEELRARFPGLASGEVLLDNAGGSQMPAAAIDRVCEYLCDSFVQLGAEYSASRRAAATVGAAREMLAALMGAGDAGSVAIAPSTTSAFALLAEAYARSPRAERDGIVVCEAGHESNVGPWLRLGERGFRVRTWRVDPTSGASDLEALEELLDERTRLVAIHHVSNVLGRVEDVEAVTRAAHAVGARVAVDGVAYAPHRAMDVARWGVDWYAFSAYKVFGPHLAALFGTHEAFAELEPPCHEFLRAKGAPLAFEPGGVQHELCAGLLGTWDHLCFLAGETAGTPFERELVERAFAAMEALEGPLQERLVGWLAAHPRVRLFGPTFADRSRVPTVSFVHQRLTSREIALTANALGFGLRHGHFYARRLIEALGLDPEDGVVRASLVHYNTREEVEGLIGLLDSIL